MTANVPALCDTFTICVSVEQPDETRAMLYTVIKNFVPTNARAFEAGCEAHGIRWVGTFMGKDTILHDGLDNHVEMIAAVLNLPGVHVVRHIVSRFDTRDYAPNELRRHVCPRVPSPVPHHHP